MLSSVPVHRPALALVSLLLLAAACVGGQSTDDVIPGENPDRKPPGMSSGSREPSMACESGRSPITEPDAQLTSTLQRLAASHSIAGRWAVPGPWVGFTPSDVPFAGQLAIERRDGELARLTGGCGAGIEVPIRVTLRTDDGALAEAADGIALISDVPVFMPLDGSPPSFMAQVRADLDLARVMGGFRADEGGEWKLGRGLLRADVTPIGSRGSLQAQLERRDPPKLGSNEVATSPPPIELLAWPSAAACERDPEREGQPWAVSTASTPALTSAIEQLEQESFRARYDDGSETMVRVQIEAPAGPICSDDGMRIPTTARMKTDDGRLDVSFAVDLDPGFAQLHINNRTDIGWAFPPAQVAARIGNIDAELDRFAHVGLEAWFDKAPSAQGWLKVLGYAPGDCLLCEGDDGCIECSWDRRVVVLTLFIGAEVDRPHP